MQEKTENGTASAADTVELHESHTEIISEATAEERIGVLEAELAQMNDKYLRSRAELENQTRRYAEAFDRERKRAIEKFAKELLEVKDTLENALADQSGQFDKLKEGVDSTLQLLIKAFEKVSIEEINPVGQSFDPHKHQAIGSEEADAEPNTVLRVMRKGYAIDGYLIRDAMVIVRK